jgi:hypothetical protein
MYVRSLRESPGRWLVDGLRVGGRMRGQLVPWLTYLT